jgi:hypothetical protein
MSNKIRIEICSDRQDWYEDLFCKYVVDPILEYSNYNPDYTRDQLKVDALKLNLPVEFVDDRLFFYVDENEALLEILKSDDPNIKI